MRKAFQRSVLCNGSSSGSKLFLEKLSVDQKIPILFVSNLGFEKKKTKTKKPKKPKKKKRKEKKKQNRSSRNEMLFSRKEVRTEERKEERNEKAEPVFDSDLRCQNLNFMSA